MTNLAIHPTTKRQLELFTSQPSHALAIVGPLGIGKSALARRLVSDILGMPEEKLSNYQYLQVITAETSISIENIRNLVKFLQLKTTGNKPLRRFAIIEHAGTMTTEAQNALLKSLEEPPQDTLIILTLENEKAMLPTILSRLQTVRVHTPTKSELKTAFASLDDKTFEQTFNLSGGLPGLMHAITSSDELHPLAAAIETAKQVLQAKTFERLQMVDSLSKQKGETEQLLQALKRISNASLAQAASKHDNKSLRRWQRVLQATHQAETAMLGGAQTKLNLTRLMLEL